MLRRFIAFAATLPSWLRPAFFGASILFAIVAIRMAFVLPQLLGQPSKLREFALGLAAATAAGAAGGFAWSFFGRFALRVPRIGPILAGIFCVAGYMGALLLAAPYVTSEPLIHDHTDAIMFAVVTIVFGAVFGRAAFKDSVLTEKPRDTTP